MCRTVSQVSYVLDTEDVMCRKLRQRRSEPDAQKQLRSDRFTRWLEMRTALRSEEVEAMMALNAGAAAVAAAAGTPELAGTPGQPMPQA